MNGDGKKTVKSVPTAQDVIGGIPGTHNYVMTIEY